ncbi:long-chain-alcohol oxidase fao1 [Phtheirospermum japonicum]|uniref:Cholesterol oxidase n=1 Tax=Phtheirospermum japonicum TaxID=374723 RepID=A0A830D8H5_9LAMI|nr:long-chain-alcohol oxidase fao1 [Phtheirospermum japonicum]
MEKSEVGYDAVVVGSGYGGSVAACRMSMAGIKVCLLEKGRKWEALDFPTDCFKMLSAVRLENRNLGLDLGSKDALFQLHVQGDALAATACGLGGGSLVNAGVMLPTTVRARRDPKWPKSWEEDWDACEASASDMLRVQSVPTKFQNSRIMEGVVGQEYDKNVDNPIKLSVNFDIEQLSGSKMSQENGRCLACGNCLSGCPYNAKNSTDRTYLVSAIQVWCSIKTECEVQYVVRNYKDDSCKRRSSSRRWLVFLSEFDYVESDIVILSAGVFGTAKILFQSQLRGLRVSHKLGSGLSCNGNYVAYLARSPAPLNATGLDKKQFPNIAFQERPGPSISSSYTSSLGFTIQHALGWNCGQDMVLNAIGHDESNGQITFEKDTNRISFQPPHDRLLPRKVEALRKLAKKLGGALFVPRFRSTSVHLLGGCIASPDISSGVCDPGGRVFDTSSPTGTHPGLYICDASLIPCSVGINPCLTIASAAEHVSRRLVRDNYNNNIKNVGNIVVDEETKRCYSKVTTTEIMRGRVGGMPCTAYLKLRFDDLLRGEVGGYIECQAIETDKMYVIHGEVDLCRTDVKTPYTQYMRYYLVVGASSGSRYVLEGRKIMNPYLLGVYVWRESTTLTVTLRKISDNMTMGEEMMCLKGKLRVSLLELVKSICALGGEDDLTIRCQHWECSQLKQEKRKYPALLINGYATESYCLPTEKNDLVRTLLKERHDVWLLHARVHWSISSNQFSVEDIGRLDIPAAINKIIEFYGESIKVHVIAHCVGGLAIHISLMGGHVSAKYIASLCCTNSSMFYKLTASSSVKMWLPLVPMSMAILGKNNILPMLQESTTSFRHRLLKSIARLMPRYERCPLDECQVFSGIFGNAYWHENISNTMHHWMNKENLPKLPMSAFRHLRKICNAGFIVDGNGSNSYLIYPERMALPTLYVSGGRTLLVTPETSFLANKYMKMHQPGYRHERVVVDGFGHSDLLIGEKSDEIVFPHVLKHVELAEEETGSDCLRSRGECDEGVKEALAWSVDPYEDEGGVGSWVFCFLLSIVLVVILFRLFFLSIFFL